MYGVALRGLTVFWLAGFAMMSSLCFIWKSILQYLQTATLCLFLIVLHLKLANVYTETTVVTMERQLRLCRHITKEKEERGKKKKNLGLFSMVLFKNRRKLSHMCMELTGRVSPGRWAGGGDFSLRAKTYKQPHRVKPQNSVMRWSILNRQTCECDNLSIWNSFHLKSVYRQLWPFIQQYLLLSTTFCWEIFFFFFKYHLQVVSDI